jgi:hypothetical protein
MGPRLARTRWAYNPPLGAFPSHVETGDQLHRLTAHPTGYLK